MPRSKSFVDRIAFSEAMKKVVPAMQREEILAIFGPPDEVLSQNGLGGDEEALDIGAPPPQYAAKTGA